MCRRKKDDMDVITAGSFDASLIGLDKYFVQGQGHARMSNIWIWKKLKVDLFRFAEISR